MACSVGKPEPNKPWLTRADACLTRRRYFGHVAAAVLTLLGLWYVVGPFLWSPNDHLYAFGGDALVLYYNALYHVWYGAEGDVLDAMLYPEGELIFMTDAQGMLVVAMQWVSRQVFDLRDSIIGVIHTVNNLAVIAAAPITYAAAVRLGVNRLLALLLIPSVVLLSPQMLRLGGHFGLAYPFVIPLTIWWFLRERRAWRRWFGRPDWRDAGVLLVLSFFTFNNPYVGFSAGLTLTLACGLAVAFTPTRRSAAVTTGALASLALLGVYAYLKFADFHDDRVGLQWGPLVYRTDWSGSLFPPGSLLRRYFSGDTAAEWEAYQYLGVVPVFGISLWATLRAGAAWTGQRARETVAVPAMWWCYVAAAFAVYLLCYDWDVSPETARLIEERAGFLLMFKAIARIAWPFYFAVALSGLLALTAVVRLSSPGRPWAIGLLCAAAVYVAVDDVRVYHRDRYPAAYANLLASDSTAAYRSALEALDPPIADVQALLAIPRLVAWHDNVIVDWDWAGQMAITRASLALGRPMLNATLGRAPTMPLLAVTQLAAHPLLPRGSLLTQLDPELDILLVKSETATALPDGERWLLSIADSLGSIRDASFFRLSPKRLAAAQRDYRSAALNAVPSPSPPLSFEGFDAGAATFGERVLGGYCSGSATLLPPGEHVLTEITLPDSPIDQTVMASAWVRTDWRRYGSGQLRAETFTASGRLHASGIAEVRRSPDVHGVWRRVSVSIDVPPGGRLRVAMVSVREERVDNVQVQWAGEAALAGGGRFLDNYCIGEGASGRTTR